MASPQRPWRNWNPTSGKKVAAEVAGGHSTGQDACFSLLLEDGVAGKVTALGWSLGAVCHFHCCHFRRPVCVYSDSPSTRFSFKISILKTFPLVVVVGYLCCLLIILSCSSFCVFVHHIHHPSSRSSSVALDHHSSPLFASSFTATSPSIHSSSDCISHYAIRPCNVFMIIHMSPIMLICLEYIHDSLVSRSSYAMVTKSCA